MIGQKFNRWLVVASAVRAKNYQRRWLCLCDCGSKKIVQERHFVSGQSKSCGCLTRESTIKRLTTHGMSKSGAHRSWLSMRARCERPDNNRYPAYGGRGITVCERWSRFENFLADMGERPEGMSIDRIDNNGNYEPSNCRWASDAQQRVNKRQRTAKPKRPCSIAGCLLEHDAKGFCWYHYKRLIRYGDPLGERKGA